jgi:hypothetical protein
MFQSAAMRRTGVAAPSMGRPSPVDKVLPSFHNLERFRAKWIPVRVKNTRQNKNLDCAGRQKRTGGLHYLVPGRREGSVNIRKSRNYYRWTRRYAALLPNSAGC